jgi:iron-sulfur cluster repair protein YtfE (RIC family)
VTADIALPGFDPRQPIARIASSSPAVERLLETLGVDYWFSGDFSVERVCERAGVSISFLANELRSMDRSAELKPFARRSTAELITEIDLHYDRAVRPSVGRTLQKLRLIRANFRHRDLGKINQVLVCVSRQLDAHVALGRTTLFPYFGRLEEAVAVRQVIDQTRLASCWRGRMALDHSEILGDLTESRRLLATVSPPPNRHPIIDAALTMIREVEEQLHHHVMLEQQFLFPLSVHFERMMERFVPAEAQVTPETAARAR